MSDYTDLTDAVTRSLNNLLRKGMLHHNERTSRQIVCAAARRWVAQQQPMAKPPTDDARPDAPVVGVPTWAPPDRNAALLTPPDGHGCYDRED